MTEPLTDQQLAAMQTRVDLSSVNGPETTEGMLAAALAEVTRLRAELVQTHADVARIQRWAAETVHGSAAAEVLLLIRNLVEPPAPDRA